MTSPVPDALRTQLAEVLRKHDVGAFSGSEIGCTCNRRWYPAAEWREHVADALLPFLARARAEGAAEALQEAATCFDRGSTVGVIRLHVVGELRKRAAALSAPTTTEGDPT